MRGLGAEAVKVGDERRRALETVLDHAGDIGVAQRMPPARDAPPDDPPPAVVAGAGVKAVRRPPFISTPRSRRLRPRAGWQFPRSILDTWSPFYGGTLFSKRTLTLEAIMPFAASPRAQLMRALCRHCARKRSGDR
jgi:hypothetical protein